MNNLRSQFFLKRLNRHQFWGLERGRVHLSYVFVDSSEDFEHLQLPGSREATPTQTSGAEIVATEEEPSETPELPPGWEERTVSC